MSAKQTTKQNDLNWRKTCTGLKFDLEHCNGPQTKFIRDSLYKHPVNKILDWKFQQSSKYPKCIVLSSSEDFILVLLQGVYINCHEEI